MAAKKAAESKSTVITHQSPQDQAPAVEREASKNTRSQSLARLATTSVLSSITLKRYSGCGDDLDVNDLIVEMKKAGDEAVAGNMGRVERMLANQMLILDALFNNLAQRSCRQESLKGIEVLMRLALKAQGQARATAETLAVVKNPMPYIKQANFAQGHQQVNNVTEDARAENSKSEQNKLLEVHHGHHLVAGATAASGGLDSAVATVGTSHRPPHT